MPKKILSLLLSLCLLIALPGCRRVNPAGTASDTSLSSTHETENSPTQTAPFLTEATPAPTETETAPLPTETEPEPTVTEPVYKETEPPIWETELDDTYTDLDGGVDWDTLWTPLCDSYITLWKTAGGSESICTIPVGATFELLEWHGKYALVSYQGKRGYVTANYIQPTDKDYFAKRLRVVTPTCQYSYEQMLQDMKSLQSMYPEDVRLSTIGKSEAGRDIPVMIVGNPNAENHVLIQGAIHGREHFTAWLLMAIADYSLVRGYLNDGTLCVHIIPMSNPDGVIISQTQTLNSTQSKIYQQDLAQGYTTADKSTYAKLWKANGLGIDLNRNFPAGWENSTERTEASSSHYRGESALCASETKALVDYTRSRTFAATLSFHSHGSVLYYSYGNNYRINNLSYDLAMDVYYQTGYIPVREDGTSGAGYKDWVLEELQIPSLTIEIGSYETPLVQRDLYNTFARFDYFFPAVSLWLP